MSAAFLRASGAGVALVMLSGCLGVDFPTRGASFMDDAPALDQRTTAMDATQADGSTSDIINTLMVRQSVLTGTAYGRVAEAVMDANSRVAESELRAAMLRSEARSRNWLPRLGPSVSLTDLGDVVAGLVVDAVLFDNGGRRAERDFAMADVEVAAVALAQDSNARVLAGLELYLDAGAARARPKRPKPR